MNVLIVGGGGREHALAWKLVQSPRVTKLFATPGSAAISRLAACVSLGGNDAAGHEAIANFAQRERIDLVVVGPEDPLVAGLADVLRLRGIRVFGPGKAAAQLEGSKAFAKAFMARHGIPTAAYRTFTRLDDALRYVDTLKGKFVVKASGLAAGKGVIICADRLAGHKVLRQMMSERIFGESGSEVVIEGFLTGEEASFLVLAEGEDFLILPCCQDHKPVGEFDVGPNTGGMGAYAPTPLVTPEVEARVLEKVIRPALRGMVAEGHPYRGVLYAGLMIDAGEPSVVEFNCRFGDPECEVQMLLLESDLLDLLEAVVDGGIAHVKPRWNTGAAACVVMAAPGYPGTPKKGLPIRGLEDIPDTSTRVVFHSGTSKRGGRWVTNGGRVLTVSARGEDLRRALDQAYGAVSRIEWRGAILRRDIGLKGLLRQRASRPEKSVVIYGRPGAKALAREVAKELGHFGIGAILRVAGNSPGRIPEGAEAILLLPGVPARVAQELVNSGLPVVSLRVSKAGNPSKSRAVRGTRMPLVTLAAAVRADGPGDAVGHLVRIFALKYPDIHARLRLAQLGAERA